MPDPIQIAGAAGLAAIVAAVVLAAFAIRGRGSRPRAVPLGSILGVAAGYTVGCAWLGVSPEWPPAEDQDRLLLIVLPAVVIAEMGIAIGIPGWAKWLLRFGIACLAARVLLHGSVYLVEPAENELAWTGLERWSVLVIGALALAGMLGVMHFAARNRPSRWLPASLGLVCASAGLTVMLSGYASGGQLGLVLAGSLIGMSVGSIAMASAPEQNGAITFGLVGLFSLLLVGRYFGELTFLNAVALFLIPLVFTVPVGRWLSPRFSWAARPILLMVALLPIGLILAAAAQRFEENSKASTPTEKTEAADYQGFRR